MASKILTEAAIKAAKPKSSVYRLYDRDGLHLVITPAGDKSWWLGYSSPELKGKDNKPKRRSVRLGRYPGLSLKDARKAAEPVRTQIEQNVDPLEQKARDETKRLTESEGTFGDLLDLYVEFLTASGATSAALASNTLKKYAAPYRSTPAIQITGDDIIAMMNAVIRSAVKRRYTGERAADQLRAHLTAAWEFGCRACFDPKWSDKAKPFRPLLEKANPVRYVAKFQKTAVVGERFLTKDEIAHLWHNMGAINPKFRAYFKLTFALGGQRVVELLHARWSEFDFESGVWSIPFERRKVRRKSQHREPHLVIVTPFEMALLDDLHRFTGRTEFLFPDRSDKLPSDADSLGTSFRRYFAVTGFPAVTPRDLRRSWKTLAGEAGLGLEIRNRIQGHAFQDVASKHYDRFSYLEEKRQAMLKWCRWLQAAVTGKPATVIELGNRRG